jgi:phosphoesterase RecJ-like protein
MIVPHQNPDGDALGSATAFFHYLEYIKKPAVIFCVTPASKRWAFLHHIDKLTTDPIIFSDPLLDTIVVLDSGDLLYAGIHNLTKNHPAKIINIDHHTTNEQYGHLNLVIPTASSTTEVLFRFFKHNNIPFNSKMATSLLTGFITDTDSFTNAATSAEALAAASELIHHGGSLNTVNVSTIKNKSVESLKLWGIVLSRLKQYEPLNLTYTYITQKDFNDHNFNEQESEGIANLLNNLSDTEIALMLKETSDGYYKGSFRTTREGVDVSVLAKKLGGGGHKKAAGFKIKGTLEEVLGKILV